MASITSANSVFTLVIPLLYPAPQQLQGYAVDDAFDDEAIQFSESQMGVDGRKSAGFTPSLTKQTIMLMADSPSLSLFEYWMNAMKAAREVIPASGSILLPGTGKSYVLVNGSLETGKQMPAVKKVLQAQSFVIAWEGIFPSLA